MQSKVLPCVLARSDVSITPPRLWPGAQWTVAVQGAKGKCLVYVVHQAADPTIAPWNHEGRIPSILGGIKSSPKVQAMYSRNARSRELLTTAYHINRNGANICVAGHWNDKGLSLQVHRLLSMIQV